MKSSEIRGTRGIERSSPIPYYYQLQEILKEEIEQGTWRANDLLPSEGELERRFGISRTVVRQALDVLQADGQISRVKGKGSIVCEPKFRWEATASARDWHEAEPAVEVLVGQLIDQRRVPAGGLIGRLLEVGESGPVFELTFTQLVDHQAVALSQSYLRPEASPMLHELLLVETPPAILRNNEGDALSQLAQRYGVRPGLCHVTVEMTSVNDFESGILLVPQGTPAYLLAALDRDATDAPISFTRTVLRADRARISMTLRRNQDGPVDLTSLAPFIAGDYSAG